MGVCVKNPLTTEQLYDLFLLGLWRLRQEREDILARTATSVFGAYIGASVITKTQRKAIAIDYKLVTLAMGNAEIIKAARKPRKQKIVELIGGLDKHLVVLIVPEESPNFTKFFGPKGYEIVITDTGIAHAAGVERKYADLVTAEKFFTGWLAHKRTAAALARTNSGKSKTVQAGVPESSDGKVGYIPPAPYSESEFEF